SRQPPIDDASALPTFPSISTSRLGNAWRTHEAPQHPMDGSGTGAVVDRVADARRRTTGPVSEDRAGLEEPEDAPYRSFRVVASAVAKARASTSIRETR